MWIARSAGICFWLVLLAGWGLSGVAGMRSAQACSPPVMAPFQVDPALAASDRQAPSRPRIAQVNVLRYEDQGTCGSFGDISIRLADVSDDRTPPEQLGYQIDVVSGTAPRVIGRINGTPQFFGGTALHLWAGYEETANADFEFTVTLFDKAGNRGEASVPARARCEGCASGTGPADILGLGCSVAATPWVRRAPAFGPAVALLAGLLALGRRRRGPGPSR